MWVDSVASQFVFKISTAYMAAKWTCMVLHSKKGIIAGGNAQTDAGLDFFIPPHWAIAHHLIKLWSEQPSGWFSKL